MRRLRTAITAGIVAALAVTTIAAEEDAAVTVEAKASISGTTATVNGTAVFPEAAPQSVDGVVTEFAAAAAASNGWSGLNDALIETTEEGLVFTWVLDALPAPPPPEGLRYTWSFAVDGDTYQLQAKTSNLIGTTTADDPAGHAGAVGGTFQVRGNCTTSYQGTPVSNCPHIGFVDGAFNTGDGTVTMTLPYGFNDQIEPGIEVIEHQTATMSIAASYQAAVSNTASSQYINGWIDSYIVGPRVRVAAEAPGTSTGRVDFDEGVLAELADDGSFSATLEIEGGQAVFVEACQGFTCTVVEL